MGQMPTRIVIGSQQPFEANEMSPMNPKPTLYMKDQNNDTVHSVGTEADIESVTSDLFNVEGRSLSARFTMLNTLNPVNTSFTVVVSVWDDALDMPADASVVPTDITCTISVMGVAGVELGGTLEVPVTGGNATFSDLEVAETVSNAMMAVDCSNPTGEFLAVAIS